MNWIKLHRGGEPIYLNAPFMQSVSPESKGGSLIHHNGPGVYYWAVDETPEQVLAMLGENNMDVKIRQAAEVDMVAELLDEISSAYATGEYHLMPKLLLQIENTLGIK